MKANPSENPLSSIYFYYIMLLIYIIFRCCTVGVDACIDPAECTVITKICGKFITSQRADVGIGPYRALANPYCLATFERKADLPQPFKGNCLQICCTVTGGAYHSARRVTMCVRSD